MPEVIVSSLPSTQERPTNKSMRQTIFLYATSRDHQSGCGWIIFNVLQLTQNGYKASCLLCMADCILRDMQVTISKTTYADLFRRTMEAMHAKIAGMRLILALIASLVNIRPCSTILRCTQMEKNEDGNNSKGLGYWIHALVPRDIRLAIVGNKMLNLMNF